MADNNKTSCILIITKNLKYISFSSNVIIFISLTYKSHKIMKGKKCAFNTKTKEEGKKNQINIKKLFLKS